MYLLSINIRFDETVNMLQTEALSYYKSDVEQIAIDNFYLAVTQ
ncbi:hypothetical protein C427_2074 [Paraglaciecola psychrophila 170]|uniref:Uncharacterized protein n=1 Tax=Paraglaciecola psychrophila 170 TaxID=1129794 RepID=K6ZWZ0_9ALTE|nr:hypothetical protein C427_2074 [Paraglaciecola psychrophila 170]GAC40421.1 hypothetical protein GPSY_4819 [Paraglaciecola psychrophila 170]